jgi:hypothetical protein
MRPYTTSFDIQFVEEVKDMDRGQQLGNSAR